MKNELGESRKVPFTRANVTTLPYIAGRRQVYYFDTKTPGLSLSVTARSRSYIFYRRIDTKLHCVQLGKVNELGLDEARRAVEELTGKIRSSEYQQSTNLTFGELYSRYMSTHAEQNVRGIDELRRMWRRDCEGQWGDRRISTITTEAIQAWVDDIGIRQKKPAKAKKLFNIVRAVFEWGIRRNQFKGLNPAKGVEVIPDRGRDRFLSTAEYEALIAACDADENQDDADIVRLCLFTGQRKGNVMSMRWDELHLELERWIIPAAKLKSKKAKEAQGIVPLVDEALSILRKRHLQTQHKEWVFPSKTPTKYGHIAFCQGWRRIRRRAGLEDQDLVLHDLRRTLGSYLGMTNANSYTIARAMNHRSLASSEKYVFMTTDPVKVAMTKAYSLMKGEDSKVVPIKRKA